ncbi:hypothetical protein Kintu_gp34c [Xanthomonas phage Kintu]
MTKQKKPKTGDVVGWAVVNANGAIATTEPTRKDARYALLAMNGWGNCKPYRLGKVILSK